MQPITKDLLKNQAQMIIHAVHRADDRYSEPFADDKEYEQYLWEIQRVLFRFYEDVQR